MTRISKEESSESYKVLVQMEGFVPRLNAYMRLPLTRLSLLRRGWKAAVCHKVSVFSEHLLVDVRSLTVSSCSWLKQ